MQGYSFQRVNVLWSLDPGVVTLAPIYFVCLVKFDIIMCWYLPGCAKTELNRGFLGCAKDTKYDNLNLECFCVCANARAVRSLILCVVSSKLCTVAIRSPEFMKYWLCCPVTSFLMYIRRKRCWRGHCSSKACQCCSVPCLIEPYILLVCGSMMIKEQMPWDTCLEEIGLCLYIFWTIPHSVVNTIGRTLWIQLSNQQTYILYNHH